MSRGKCPTPTWAISIEACSGVDKKRVGAHAHSTSPGPSRATAGPEETFSRDPETFSRAPLCKNF